MASIQGVYVALFGRPADPFGLAYFNTATNNGADLSKIGDLSASDEYKARFAGQSNVQIINSIYQSLFGRDADAAGLTFFVNALNSGKINMNNIAINILDGAQGNDKTIVTNKIAAADLYTKALDTGSEIVAYSGTAAAKAGIDFIKTVTTTVPSTTAVDASVAAMVTAAGNGGTGTGTSFTLTDKIGESIVGTTGNDTFKAVFATGVASDSTLNLGDSIDGGAGTDTLNLVMTASNAMPNGVTIKNIEVINLDVSAAGSAGAGTSFLTSSAYEGVKEIWQVNTNGIGAATTAKFGNVTVGDGVIAGFRGNGTVEGTAAATNAGAADASVSVTAASATQKALTVALDGIGSSSSLTFAAAAGGKIETVTITGSVAGETSSTAGKLKIDAGADALTVNGSFTSSVDVGTAITGAKIKTVDFSGSAGAVTINASGLTSSLETIKTGAGNDKVTVDLGVKLVAIDLGAGNDTLAFLEAASADGKEVSVTLGAGKDTIEVAANTVKNVIDTADLTKGLITITDFKLGDDTIDLKTTGMTLTSAQLDTAKGAASLKAAAESVAGVIGASKSAVFSYGGDAYILHNDGNAAFGAGDGLIKVTGLDASLLSTNQNGGLLL